MLFCLLVSERAKQCDLVKMDRTYQVQQHEKSSYCFYKYLIGERRLCSFVTKPVRLIGQWKDIIFSIYSLLSFLTCVFWELIQLNLDVNKSAGYLPFGEVQVTKIWAERRHAVTHPKKLPHELCLFLGSHSKQKGWDHFDAATVLSHALSCFFQNCCVSINSILE